MAKLSDTQAVLLSAAAARADQECRQQRGNCGAHQPPDIDPFPNDLRHGFPPQVMNDIEDARATIIARAGASGNPMIMV